MNGVPVVVVEHHVHWHDRAGLVTVAISDNAALETPMIKVDVHSDRLRCASPTPLTRAEVERLH